MDVDKLGVIFTKEALGRYGAQVVTIDHRLYEPTGALASGLGQTPQDALLNAAKQWAGEHGN